MTDRNPKAPLFSQKCSNKFNLGKMLNYYYVVVIVVGNLFCSASNIFLYLSPNATKHADFSNLQRDFAITDAKVYIYEKLALPLRGGLGEKGSVPIFFVVD
jgi:hypothetical protein